MEKKQKNKTRDWRILGHWRLEHVSVRVGCFRPAQEKKNFQESEKKVERKNEENVEH